MSATRGDPIVRVAIAADERYATPLAAAVCSLAGSFDDISSLEVYVLDGGLSRATKGLLRSLWPPELDVGFLEAYPEWLGNVALPGNRRWLPQLSRSMYLRLLIPDLLPQVNGKVLYLDSDVLVLADVTGLWHTDLAGYPLAAVEDPGIRTVSAPLGLLNYEELGLDPKTRYFNSGVLLLDLDTWRAENLGARVLRYAQDYQDAIRFPDQDSLNATLAGRWKQLDASWNVAMNEAFRLASSPSPPPQPSDVPPAGARVIHFTGPLKPWMSEFRHDGYRDLFRGYLPPALLRPDS